MTPAEHPGQEGRRSSTGRGGDRRGPADGAADGASGVAAMGRRAAALVSTLTGRAPESVVFIERSDGGWRVGVEVVEVARIPDSADILAVCATIAGVLMALSPFLQIRRMRRTRSSNDVSLLYLSMLAGGWIAGLGCNE